MPPVNRNDPKRAESSESQYSLMEFMREFPNDAACLDWLWCERFAEDGAHAFCPSCDRERKFHKVNDRPAWDCDSCGHHIHPLAGTIFHKSSTSLHLWFFAMHLMTSTRCGISAKQLERELGVTYKTAWRMANLIRNELMSEDIGPLNGEVEIDETAWGGKPRLGDLAKYGGNTPHHAAARWAAATKSTVFAMVERGGRVRAEIVPSRQASTLQGRVIQYVLPESTIFTDEWHSYTGLRAHFSDHRRIRHTEKVYVSGDTHTQTIEGFFSNLKRGIAGTYHAVSTKWLQSYLDEYTWRYNHRQDDQSMFRTLLLRAARS